MPGGSDITAGKAYIELALNDSAFINGLKNASKQLKAFGEGMTKIGAGISAMGAGIIAPLTAAVLTFASVGSTLNDMKGRTGASAQALAEFGYAAEMTGATLGDVETGIKKMQKAIGASGNSILQVGKQFLNLRGMKPEDQFQAVADAIAKIDNPTLAANEAMKVFGKTGTTLLPMIANLRALRKEAQDLGLAPSDEDVANADALGDAMDRTKRVAGMGLFNVGAALAEPLTAVADIITGIVVGVNKWIKENGDLFRKIALIGASMLGIGAVVTGIGLAFTVAGTAISAVVTVLGAVGAIFGVVLSPIGLITAALVAGTVAWLKFTESGQRTGSAIMGVFRDLKGTFDTTFGGIIDAIKGGDLELAGKIGMAGLKVAMLEGVVAISKAVGGEFGTMISDIGTKLLGGDFSGAWNTAVAGMQAMWAKFSSNIVRYFATAIATIKDLWKTVTSFMSGHIIKLASEDNFRGGLWRKVIGIDPREAADQEQALKNQRSKALIDQKYALTNEMHKRAAEGASEEELQGYKDKGKELDDQLKGIRDGENIASIDSQAKAAGEEAAKAIDKLTQPITDGLKAVQDQADKNLKEALEKLKKETGGTNGAGSNPAWDALVSASFDLEVLVQKAKQKAEDAANKNQQDTKDKIGDPDSLKMKEEIVGSFSAAALSAQGQTDGPTTKIVNELKEQTKKAEELRRINEALLAEVRLGGMIA